MPYASRLAELLREKHKGRETDVVVVERHEALRFLLQDRETLFSGVPVVFSGVTRKALEELPPPPNVTGALAVLEGQRSASRARSGWRWLPSRSPPGC